MAHRYEATVTWSAAEQGATTDYKSYGRGYRVEIPGRPDLLGSSDPAFRGDAGRHNPEDLLLAALSGCHLLWYLHLCATSGIVVLDYRDEATGEMQLEKGGGGQFVSARLCPQVTIASGGDVERARALHTEAAAKCFIARSVNFPVHHDPVVSLEQS
ncbi:OsmC family protein [Algihabitans albus]|uniref:OsmC family protein n=1 Tax=Algihabitans albus TaxID=2164067 RepID=UPI000E5D0730|nr:OsmC family protein [Algihabitans albus]